MAQTLKTLTRSVDTLKSIRGIVHTMKTLSAINAFPYEQAARSIGAYLDTVLDGFQAFLHHNGPLVLTSQEKAAQVVITFGSDHGLCGNYNEILADEVSRQLQRRAPTDSVVRVLCVGAQMEDALTDLGVQVESTLLPPATADGLGRLAGDLVTRLDGIRRDSPFGDVVVTLVFTERSAHGQQIPVARRLLPLEAELIEDLAHRAWKSRSLPVFNLPPDNLLAGLIRGYLFASMFRAAAEALVTENAARLARMQQAEQSIDERLEILNSETRSARQSEITTELLDVIIGYEAIKDRD
ncbi:FoF1 ATP synthase subunit gamma [Limibacillus sp. MBR-115]|jgi:F-type H+-transporting ATPase subunit gamma|uniref:F0F1 ATP synthase subunit gamma n=1 Tax=Limibacillus sp. MBR-115 TaxID=3156465 RepID=UPI00339088AC